MGVMERDVPMEAEAIQPYECKSLETHCTYLGTHNLNHHQCIK